VNNKLENGTTIIIAAEIKKHVNLSHVEVIHSQMRPVVELPKLPGARLLKSMKS
jgi:hypothetical protein